jgi:hypothetical protein
MIQPKIWERIRQRDTAARLSAGTLDRHPCQNGTMTPNRISSGNSFTWGHPDALPYTHGMKPARVAAQMMSPILSQLCVSARCGVIFKGITTLVLVCQVSSAESTLIKVGLAKRVLTSRWFGVLKVSVARTATSNCHGFFPHPADFQHAGKARPSDTAQRRRAQTI